MTRHWAPSYEPYNQYLIETFGVKFDWYEAGRTYNELGNSPGIYPDVAMLFERLLSRDDVQSVVEFGSGFSTLYLGAAARKHGKPVPISFEEDPHYAAITKQLLEIYGLPTDGLQPYEWVGGFPGAGETHDQWLARVSEHGIYPTLDTFERVPKFIDLVFHDCKGATRAWLPWQHGVTFHRANFVLMDDAEASQYVSSIVRLLVGLERPNITFYNPVGRQDRHVLLNPKDSTYRMNDWVWSWRPDKASW